MVGGVLTTALHWLAGCPPLSQAARSCFHIDPLCQIWAADYTSH